MVASIAVSVLAAAVFAVAAAGQHYLTRSTAVATNPGSGLVPVLGLVPNLLRMPSFSRNGRSGALNDPPDGPSGNPVLPLT